MFNGDIQPGDVGERFYNPAKVARRIVPLVAGEGVVVVGHVLDIALPHDDPSGVGWVHVIGDTCDGVQGLDGRRDNARPGRIITSSVSMMEILFIHCTSSAALHPLSSLQKYYMRHKN